MKGNEFKKWLKSQGVTIENGTKHYKLFFNGKQSTLPRHDARELNEGLRQAIMKQLGL